MKKIAITRIDRKSSQKVQNVLESAPKYQLNTQGTPISKDAGQSVFEALPPNCSSKQKHVLLIEVEGEPIGIVDLIEGYPDNGIAFLGLLLLKEDSQGRGLGKEAYLRVEEYIAKLSSISKVRLAYIKNNPVHGFWEKVGFSLTGEEKPYEGENIKSLAILMEKILSNH